MHGLHENQTKILDFLKEQSDGSTLDQIADYLKLSKTATKQHLLRIDGLGFIHFKDIKGEVGRPRRVYFLSEKGHESFPRQYSWLSDSLLKLLTKEQGASFVGNLMVKLAQEMTESMQHEFNKANSAKDRLDIINNIMNELGYKSVIKQRDFRKGAILEATNCVYHSVAKNNPELCKFDVEFIKQASNGMDVKLEKCISRGDATCRFCIRKKAL